MYAPPVQRLITELGKLPGIGQRGALGWLTFQDANGKVVYGGTPMGPAPRSTSATLVID